jgi:hypothetical protein
MEVPRYLCDKMSTVPSSLLLCENKTNHCICRSRDSSVGMATRYGLEGPGIESRWGEILRTYPYRLRGSPSLLYNGYWVFPMGKGGRGVMLTTHPLLVPRLRKSSAIPPLTLWVLLGLLRCSPLPLYYICGYVNLLHYKCCEPCACLGHLLWPSSMTYFKKDITKTLKPKHKHKNVKFGICNSKYMLKYKILLKFAKYTCVRIVRVLCLLYHHPEIRGICMCRWFLLY